VKELTCRVLIVGGGTGGVAAALALSSRGIDCIVTEPTPWIGGQLTSQAVPPDENQWVESFGVTTLYQHFRSLVRAWYRDHRPLTPAAREATNLNPGNGWVSRLCAEPSVMHTVLHTLLTSAPTPPRVLLGWSPIAAAVTADRIESVTLAKNLDAASTPADDQDRVIIRADYILDATELGDLYELAGVEHAIGAEGRADFGEMHARADHADPLDQQAFSWCFAMEHRPDEDHRITKPARYDFWKSYTPFMDPPWCGPLFSWTVPTHNTEGSRTFPFIPWPQRCPEGMWDMWRYRRISDASIYEQDAQHPTHPDVCLVNWVQMDYWLKPLLGVKPHIATQALAEAREQSLCLFYWMQNDAPRFDGGTGFPGLKLRGDELGTTDGFAMAPYIREPRRLKARTILTEAHIGTEQRAAEGKPGREAHPFGTAELFADSIGIGHYTLDLHPSTAGRNSIYVPAAPFRIPLGSLIPVRMRNLIAAGKGIGVTHITNGCTRMHHTEWNIGESAGHLAAYCLANSVEPAQVHESPPHLADYQTQLTDSGVRLAWPWEK
jgi:hypothetical protein